MAQAPNVFDVQSDVLDSESRVSLGLCGGGIAFVDSSAGGVGKARIGWAEMKVWTDVHGRSWL